LYIYTPWVLGELMNLVGTNGSASLLFMMQVMMV
jgi:hypothetical protein